MTMHPALEKRISAFRQQAESHPAPEQYYAVVSSPSTARIRMQNLRMSEPAEFLNFATSNYLGMGQRPEVLAAAVRALEKYGLGANGSPVLSGYFEVHRDLDRELAELHGAEDALLFPSGMAANAGVISALVGVGDAVVLDELAHGSLMMGARASGASIRFYRHQDYEELDWLLKRFAGTAKSILLAVMGVYSMSGEIEDLPAVLDLARKHGAVTLIDDAHALGVLGERGTGTLEHHGLPPDAVDLHMGTMSKALSGAGGYIAGPKAVVQYLRFNAKPHVLSASPPPAVAAGCLEALRILRREGRALSSELRRKAGLFRAALREGGADALGEHTAIVPVRLKDEEKIWPVNRLALERRVFLNPVVFPGVPQGQGRLRFAVTTGHSDDDLRRGARVVGECIRACDA